jgi:hypothetical protein
VWFVALLAFVLLSSFDFLDPYSCLLFFYAVPANAIVLLSLRSAWHDFRWNKALISIIVWGTLLSIYITDSPEAIEMGILRMTYVCLPYFICGLMDVSSGALRGLGSSFAPMMISVLRVGGVMSLWL